MNWNRPAKPTKLRPPSPPHHPSNPPWTSISRVTTFSSLCQRFFKPQLDVYMSPPPCAKVQLYSSESSPLICRGKSAPRFHRRAATGLMVPGHHLASSSTGRGSEGARVRERDTARRKKERKKRSRVEILTLRSGAFKEKTRAHSTSRQDIREAEGRLLPVLQRPPLG